MLAQDPPGDGKVTKLDPKVNVQVAAQPKVPVPDVAGQDATAAAATLGQATLQVTTRTAANDTVPAGKVIGTDPGAGTPVAKGSSVVLIISSGPALIDIPNVVGQLQAPAVSALQDAGFGVIITFLPGTPANRGKVLTQTPASGQAARLTNVSIVVGS